jgi:hypothetical protein
VEIDDEHDFLRHVGGSHIHGDIINGSAFERTLKDVDGLSISIRGFFSENDNADVAKIRELVGARRKLGKTSVFAELNVGTAVSVLHEFDSAITVVLKSLPAEDGKPEDPSHALIVGLPIQGEPAGSLTSELAGDLLARRIIRTYPAVL